MMDSNEDMFIPEKINWYNDNPVIIYHLENEWSSTRKFDVDAIVEKETQAIHLEIIGDENISLLTAHQIVEQFEFQLSELDIKWNITPSIAIKPNAIIVCCVCQSS